MELEQYKTLVSDLYARAYDRRPDPKAVVFWANALYKGEKTDIDLVTFIIKSVEYHSRVLTKYRSLWLEIIGTDFDCKVFDAFFSRLTDELKIATEIDLTLHIKSCDSYTTKVSGLVTNLFVSRYNRDPTPQELALFVSKFQGMGDYTISMLENDFMLNQQAQQAQQAQEPTVTSEHPSWAQELDAVNAAFPDKSEDERDVLAQQMHALKSDDRALIEHLCAPIKPAPLCVDESFVTNFEAKFERPMFIQEYAKYFGDRHHINLDNLHKTHIDRFNEIHNVLFKYLAKHLSEHEFVRDFLSKMDDPEFVPVFCKNIVHDPTYMALMSENIAKRYSQLYDEQLDAAEVAYIFERVQVTHLELNDTRLDDHLLAFKNETDDIVKRVYKMYMDIYERTPDRTELFEKFNHYRAASKAGVVFETIDEQVERDLMACLEFHDIIKKRIRVYRKDIPVSDMFKVLSRLLADIADIRIVDLDARIRIYCGEKLPM